MAAPDAWHLIPCHEKRIDSLAMAFFLAVYSNNDLVSVVETIHETEEKIVCHNDGLLIYAIIKAETVTEANTLATEISLQQKRKLSI
jgi:hypothetical protein